MNLEQPLHASSPIEVTDGGIVMVLFNAPASMEVTEEGMTRSVAPLHPLEVENGGDGADGDAGVADGTGAADSTAHSNECHTPYNIKLYLWPGGDRLEQG